MRPGSDLLIRTDYIWVMTDPEQDLAPRMFLEFVKTAKTAVGLFHQFELQSGHTSTDVRVYMSMSQSTAGDIIVYNVHKQKV